MAKKKTNQNVIIKERKRLGFLGLPFSFTTYTLTDKKLIVNKGLFNTVEDEILLYRIVDVTISSKFTQKLFGFGIGNVKVVSSDKSDPKLDIVNIKHYKEFRQYLSNQVEEERLRVKFRAGEMIDRDTQAAEAYDGGDGHDGYDEDDHFGIAGL